MSSFCVFGSMPIEPAQSASHCSASPLNRARRWHTASAPSSPQRIPLRFSSSLTTVLHAASMCPDPICQPDYTDPYRVFSERNRPLSERMMVDDTLVFDAGRLAHVRSVVTQHAVDSGVDKARLNDLGLAVSEICSRAADHVD